MACEALPPHASAQQQQYVQTVPNHMAATQGALQLKPWCIQGAFLANKFPPKNVCANQDQFQQVMSPNERASGTLT
eukprot:4518946-Amphidinium_carterae.2